MLFGKFIFSHLQREGEGIVVGSNQKGWHREYHEKKKYCIKDELKNLFSCLDSDSEILEAF